MSKKIQFQKLEAAGNDFILVDAREQDIPYEQLELISPKICHRKTGIGADGLLILYPDSTMGADYTMIYKNADGSDAGMCGNGGRATALYASQNGFSDRHRIQVHDQIYEAFIHSGSHQVELQFPDSDAPCPLSKQWLDHVNSAYQVQNIHKENANARKFMAKAAFKAYPQTEHVVLFTNDPLAIQPVELLSKLGHNIRNDDIFYPKGTNVNFVYSQQAYHIQLETYERGVEDFTLACGTGAVASALSMHINQNRKIGSHVYKITVQGGLLEVSFDYSGMDIAPQGEHDKVFKRICLKGPARRVYSGIWAGN
ncbi:MAG: diaminopimelate epimerase [Balneola sp.]|nr:diaminopimelate epimerase [Balneola sp.]